MTSSESYYSLTRDFGTMALNTEYLVQSDVGENLTYVGYGLTDSDRANSGGTRRKVNVPIYYYDNNFAFTYADGESKNVCNGPIHRAPNCLDN